MTKPVSINVTIMAITIKRTSYKDIVIDVEVRTAEDKEVFRNHQEDSMKLSGAGSLPATGVSTWLITTEDWVVSGPSCSPGPFLQMLSLTLPWRRASLTAL